MAVVIIVLGGLLLAGGFQGNLGWLVGLGVLLMAWAVVSGLAAGSGADSESEPVGHGEPHQ